MFFLADTAVIQAGKFGLVGILNTLIDFIVFNVLSGKRFKMSKINANIISATCAMIFSFFANREGVFHASGGDFLTQSIIFFVVTGFGLYVLQNIVLYFLLRRWSWPEKLVKYLLKKMRIKKLSTDFVLKNGAKVAATGVSLIWNFILYKYVVFV